MGGPIWGKISIGGTNLEFSLEYTTRHVHKDIITCSTSSHSHQSVQIHAASDYLCHSECAMTNVHGLQRRPSRARKSRFVLRSASKGPCRTYVIYLSMYLVAQSCDLRATARPRVTPHTRGTAALKPGENTAARDE